jgi:hypothetical protein
MNGPAYTTCESHDPPRPVAQTADTVEGGINAGTVVTTKLTNLHKAHQSTTKHSRALVKKG